MQSDWSARVSADLAVFAGQSDAPAFLMHGLRTDQAAAVHALARDAHLWPVTVSAPDAPSGRHVVEVRSPARFRETVDAFADRMRTLLEIEYQETIQQLKEQRASKPLRTLQRMGLVLPRMTIAGVTTGLVGKWRLLLEHPSGVLPALQFGVGDCVALTLLSTAEDASPVVIDGVVHSVNRTTLTVAVEKVDDRVSIDEAVRVDVKEDSTTHRRLLAAVDSVQRRRMCEGNRLVDLLFTGGRNDLDAPEYATSTAEDAGMAAGASAEYESLNEPQRRAIEHALAARDIALIHGPPGTGKTTTVAEFIRRAVASVRSAGLVACDARNTDRARVPVLACAPSNVAVDNLLDKLLRACGGKLRVVRIGHPSRVAGSLLQHTLDAQLASSDAMALSRDAQDELDQAVRQLKKAKQFAERRQLYGSIRELRKEVRERAIRAREQILREADVVLCTNTGAGSKALQRIDFEIVVIDEAAQSTEISCWIPLLKGTRAVLAGDHLQLPPTVIGQAAVSGGLAYTLFERVHGMFAERVARQLRVQYRMHETIMGWANAAMYNGTLVAHESVAHRLLGDLAGVSRSDWTTSPLVLVDTAGADMFESADSEADSKSNESEAAVVVRVVERLLAAGVPTSGVGVITPYRAQVELLRSSFAEQSSASGTDWSTIEVATVDGFQGREKCAIVISLVRSNADGTVGFLADRRRTNVAITRAQRACVLVGDSGTLFSDPFLEQMVEYSFEHALVLPAADVLSAPRASAALLAQRAAAAAAAVSPPVPGAAKTSRRGAVPARRGAPDVPAAALDKAMRAAEAAAAAAAAADTTPLPLVGASIRVRVRHQEADLAFDVDDGRPVDVLLAAIESRTGVPVANQKLVLRGKRIASDAATARDAGLTDGVALMLIGVPVGEISAAASVERDAEVDRRLGLAHRTAAEAAEWVAPAVAKRAGGSRKKR